MSQCNISYQNDFIDSFKSYFLSNDISKKKNELLNWLDDVSRDLVLLLIDRYINLIPSQKYMHSVCFSKKIFTKEELLEQKKVIKDYVFINRNRIFGKKVSLFESFNYTYDLWLCFLWKDIINRLKYTKFIDVWSYDGFTSFIMQKYTPYEIYLFEINSDILDESKILLSQYNNINYNNIALYSNIWDYYVYLNGLKSFLFTKINKKINKKNTRRIKSITLDEYAYNNSIDNIWLIKIDTEWSDMDVIKWSKWIIKKYKPVLLVSIYHSPVHFFELKKYLKNINPGYKFMIRKIMPFDLVNETVLIAY